MSRKIAITGSTGLVGSAVVKYFQKQGDTITPFVRPQTKMTMDQPVIRWNVAKEDIDLDNLEGQDVVIHLAGASIADKRWSNSYKQEIFKSRVDGTTLLARTFAKLKQKPKVFLSASAIGFYGSRAPETVIDETFPQGNGFLADVCAKWEEAALIAKSAGIRTVLIRIGVVLDAKGGALAKMMPIFSFGLGGVLGDGKQMMSWVSLKEMPAMMDHVIRNPSINGPVNFTSPQTVSNREFTQTLSSVIHRPAFLPVPNFGLRLLFGEMADALLLEGARVKPHVLEKTGYQFKYQKLEDALKGALQK